LVANSGGSKQAKPIQCKNPRRARVYVRATKTSAALPNPGGVIEGAFFLFVPLRWTGGDNIVPSRNRKGSENPFPAKN
jgi:hypothetical protein